jgi:integrase
MDSRNGREIHRPSRLAASYASWLINTKADGGMELPGKRVQERMGHSSIAVTMNTYGHLFPSTDDQKALAAAEKSLLGA